MAAPGFWNNQEKAQATIAELKALSALLKPLDEAIAGAADLQALVEMADEDDSFAAELPAEFDAAGRRWSASWSSRACSTARTTPRAPS